MILRHDPSHPVGRRLTWTFTERVNSGWVMEWNGFEVFMTAREAGPDATPGKAVCAFVFRDSKGRLTAVRKSAKLGMGEIGFLTVRQLTPLGAFLDWGLPKELFLAKPEWKRPLDADQKVLVRVLLDEDDRPAATAHVWESLVEPPLAWKRGDTVRFCVLSRGRFGMAVSLDDTYRGFLPLPNACLNFGETGNGWYLGRDEVGRGRISLRPQGTEGLRETAELLMEKLKDNGGFLPVHDHSTPQTIFQQTGLSKNDFKKVVGLLYKERRIDILERGLAECGKVLLERNDG